MKFEGLLKVKYIDSINWYDGPLNGICEYNGETLYFNGPIDYIAIPYFDEEEKEKQYYLTRCYFVYKFPIDIMNIIVNNNKLFKELSKENRISDYHKLTTKFPEEFAKIFSTETYKEFEDRAYPYCIGYTLEDVWEKE